LTRPRLPVALASLSAALIAAPLLASLALAREPIVVRPGDTLSAISERHGVSVETIAELNGLANPNRIYVGQRLRLEPAARAAPATPATIARTHVVQPGEHLTGIARRYGVSIAAIAAANRIGDPSRIYAGQRLVIPGSAGAAPAAPAAPAGAQMPASMAALVRERDAVRRVIVDEAYRTGISAAFALAVAWQESGWQQGAVSHAGAIGVMQLLPTTAEWVGDTMLGTPVNPYDLRQNVRAGVRLLAHYLDRYDGDRALTLAAYYQGPTAVARHGIYPVSRPYIASIQVLEAIFSR
jgi:soluble lytic murein transglycosylase-like protein